MKPLWLVAGVLAAVVVPARSSTLVAQQAPPVNQPGMPTLARMMVINRGADEAVPVVVTSGGEVQPVAVISAPAVTLAPNAVVGVQALRQAWDYRHLVLRSGENVTDALNAAGADGWEAVGVAPSGVGGVQVVLKRPR